MSKLNEKILNEYYFEKMLTENRPQIEDKQNGNSNIVVNGSPIRITVADGKDVSKSFDNSNCDNCWGISTPSAEPIS